MVAVAKELQKDFYIFNEITFQKIGRPTHISINLVNAYVLGGWWDKILSEFQSFGTNNALFSENRHKNCI